MAFWDEVAIAWFNQPAEPDYDDYIARRDPWGVYFLGQPAPQYDPPSIVPAAYKFETRGPGYEIIPPPSPRINTGAASMESGWDWAFGSPDLDLINGGVGRDAIDGLARDTGGAALRAPSHVPFSPMQPTAIAPRLNLPPALQSANWSAWLMPLLLIGGAALLLLKK